MSERYSSEEWSQKFDEFMLQHSEELGLGEYSGDYLEHKFKIPGLNIEIPDIKLPKINLPKLNIPDSVKESLKTPISKAKEKVTSLAADASKAVEKAAAVVKPAKWTWPNGKNSKEYNHWYWETFKDRIKAKRGQTAREKTVSTSELTGYTKKVPWSELTNEQKSVYDNNRITYERVSIMQNEHYVDLGEMFVSQLLKRPLSLLQLDIPGYLNEVAREFIAAAAYTKAAVQQIKRTFSGEERDSATGFKKKANPKSSISEDANQVNPGFANWDSNTKNNCMLCTATYDMRRRGYDVTAKTSGIGFRDDEFTRWYPDAELKKVTKNEAWEAVADGRANGPVILAEINFLEEQLLEQGNGARGNIMFSWQGGGGHSIAYEIVGNRVVLIDCQTNTVYNNPEDLLKFAEGDLRYYRLDNVDFDPEEIKRCCRS